MPFGGGVLVRSAAINQVVIVDDFETVLTRGVGAGVVDHDDLFVVGEFDRDLDALIVGQRIGAELGQAVQLWTVIEVLVPVLQIGGFDEELFALLELENLVEPTFLEKLQKCLLADKRLHNFSSLRYEILAQSLV